MSGDNHPFRLRAFVVCIGVTFALPVGNRSPVKRTFNLLKPTCQLTHQQFNIQQLYVLPTLYLCVLYLSENKQRLAQRLS